jgi:DNA-binding transcriptional ArsR family regulator
MVQSNRHDTNPAPGSTTQGDPPMPELPPRLVLNTDQQFKAVADPLRSKILGIIQTRPATAKQIADRLGEAPGNIGHHLQMLERAGLAQVAATRVVRGIIAKYYTRTARIFAFEFPREVTGETVMSIDILEHADQELVESVAAYGEDGACGGGFPHVRISEERAQVYRERLDGLLEDLLHEPVDPQGRVYGIVFQMFLAPPYLQDMPSPSSPPNGTDAPEDE